MVYRLDQADAADLEQVVHAVAAALEALDHAEHQPQIGADEFLAGLPVPRLDLLEHATHFFVLQRWQRARIDSAQFHLVQRHGRHHLRASESMSPRASRYTRVQAIFSMSAWS